MPFPAHLDAPPSVEFSIQDFKDGQSITFRLIRGEYHHRLGALGVFVPSGAATYPRAAAHARHLHGVPAIGSRST